MNVLIIVVSVCSWVNKRFLFLISLKYHLLQNLKGAQINSRLTDDVRRTVDSVTKLFDVAPFAPGKTNWPCRAI